MHIISDASSDSNGIAVTPGQYTVNATHILWCYQEYFAFLIISINIVLLEQKQDNFIFHVDFYKPGINWKRLIYFQVFMV